MSLPAKVNAFFLYIIHKEIFAWSGTENGIKNMSERPREKLNFSTPKREFFKHVL